MSCRIALFFLVGVCIWPAITEATPRKLHVGTMLALTGPASEYGIAFQNGIELARAEEPERFRNLEFLYEDHKVQAKVAVAALQKLLDVNKVDLIVNWSVPSTAAIAPIIKKRKIPLIASSVDASATAGNPYVIRTVNHTEQLAVALMQHLRKMGYKKLGLVMNEDPYFNQLLKGLRSSLKQDESIDIGGVFHFGENDFKAHILRMRRQQIDALGVYLIPGQISLFYKQAAALGLAVPTFGTDIFESKTEIAAAGGNMSGAVYSNISIPDTFIDRYRLRYGDDNQVSYGYNGYLVAKLIGESFLDIEASPGSDDILERLETSAENAREYVFRDTAEGGKYLEFPVVIKEIRGSDIVVLR